VTQSAETQEPSKEFEDGDDKTDHVGKGSVDFLGEDVSRPRFLLFEAELGILQVDELWVVGCVRKDGEVVKRVHNTAIW